MVKNKFILYILIILLFSWTIVNAENIEIIQDTISLPSVEIIQPTPEPTPRPIIKVKIHWKEPIPQTLVKGEFLQLVSKLENCETAQSITYQWQVDKQDGNGFVDINGANNSTYTVTITKELYNYTWRLKVTVEW